jgi:hypothetical protein
MIARICHAGLSGILLIPAEREMAFGERCAVPDKPARLTMTA